MDLIGQMHQLLHEKHGVVRIQSDIRVGTRVDKPNQLPQDKINVVQRKLAQQENNSRRNERKRLTSKSEGVYLNE